MGANEAEDVGMPGGDATVAVQGPAEGTHGGRLVPTAVAPSAAPAVDGIESDEAGEASASAWEFKGDEGYGGRVLARVREDMVIWTLDAHESGGRAYPAEEVFEPGLALSVLLANEVVHLGSLRWRKDLPEAALNLPGLSVDCSDVFAWGCSDVEPLAHGDVEAVYRMWLRDPHWGPAVWCMLRRREMPQRPVERRIRETGAWDLDALRAEHGLRANRYDGVSAALAARKYAAYAAWERGRGGDPLPFDAGWWSGWKAYVAANPGWRDAAWEAGDAEAARAFREREGHD